jgi:ferredoxin
MINEKCNSLKGMGPERKRKRGLMEHCETCIHNVPMIAFSIKRKIGSKLT